METNLTFKQQLILAITKGFIEEHGVFELTLDVATSIRFISGKLSEGIPDKEPEAKKVEYPPFEKEMRYRTIRRLQNRGVETPEELIEHNFQGECLYGLVSNIELLQYAMNHNIKLKNFHYK